MVVDENFRGGRGKEHGDPLAPTWAQPKVLQKLEKEGPRDVVECSSNVQLEEHVRRLQVVQETSRLLHKEVVVVDTSSRNKRTLVGGYHGVQPWSETEGEKLRDQLGEDVYETDGSIVKEGVRICTLGEQGEEGLVKLLEAAPIGGVELVERVANILLDDVPGSSKKLGREAIWPWRF